jgi:hypothetical protein
MPFLYECVELCAVEKRSSLWECTIVCIHACTRWWSRDRFPIQSTIVLLLFSNVGKLKVESGRNVRDLLQHTFSRHKFLENKSHRSHHGEAANLNFGREQCTGDGFSRDAIGKIDPFRKIWLSRSTNFGVLWKDSLLEKCGGRCWRRRRCRGCWRRSR